VLVADLRMSMTLASWLDSFHWDGMVLVFQMGGVFAS